MCLRSQRTSLGNSLGRFPGLHLTRTSEDDFRNSPIHLDHSTHTTFPICKSLFWRPEFRAVFHPDDSSENLIWVGLIQVDECGCSRTTICEVRADHQTTDFRIFSDVISRLQG